MTLDTETEMSTQRKAKIASRENRDPWIPVFRPELPNADELLPYIKRIDTTRWYSNFGPLLRQFEDRLRERFRQPTEIATASNATQALTLSLRAMEIGAGKLCILPSFTFAATAHAVVAAGLTPWFSDIDPSTWMLDPNCVLRALSRAQGEVGAVVPVSSFGSPPDLDAWAAFKAETGVPVLVDAAAAFDVIRSAPVPTIVSLHATKAMGIGEGGFLASEDKGLVERFRSMTTFGFVRDRVAQFPATNAKLNEYACAVGLAALDAWPQKRLRFRAAAHMVRMGLISARNIIFQRGWGDNWVSSTCVVGLPAGTSSATKQTMKEASIETRQWWGNGCHRMPAFATAPSMPLPVTDHIANSTLGLPFSHDINGDTLRRIASVLNRCG